MKKHHTLFFLLLFLSCKKEEKPSVIEVVTEKETIENTTAVFGWQDNLCDNKGIYDPNKYTVRQLTDTYFLASHIGGIGLDVNTNINSPKGFETYNKDALGKELEKQYAEWKAKYNSLELVPLPYWESLRRQQLEVLDQSYELRKIMLESYDNPAILLDNRFASECRVYGEALVSDDSLVLLKAWKDFYENKIATGQMHADAEQYFDNKYNSAERLLYARADLSSYGWYNCANHQIPRPDTNVNYYGEFEKLFIKVESECDEP